LVLSRRKVEGEFDDELPVAQGRPAELSEELGSRG
jgi:hypothetical protein